MTAILAIETATDACSVALYRDGQYRELHEIAPRQHSQRLFGMLRELCPSGNLREQGIDAIAYGCGPGSFTGLRIAASAVQGLAFASGLPAIAISTLACQAQGALRLGLVDAQQRVLSVLDARIKEIYYGIFSFADGIAVAEEGPVACAPEGMSVAGTGVSLHGVGSGCQFSDQFPDSVRARLGSQHPSLLPAARDLVPLALNKLALGDVQRPQQVQPVYVRDEISWKKLAEQGKRA